MSDPSGLIDCSKPTFIGDLLDKSTKQSSNNETLSFEETKLEIKKINQPILADMAKDFRAHGIDKCVNNAKKYFHENPDELTYCIETDCKKQYIMELLIEEF